MTTNTKKLRKSKEDSMLFGVAGGMSEYFDVDSTLIRIAWIVFILASAGTALLAYIVLAIIMPKQESAAAQTSRAVRDNIEDSPEDAAEPAAQGSERRWRTARRDLFGIALIAAGVVLLLSNLSIFSWWRWDVFWPLAIIAIGVALTLGRFIGGSDD